MYPTGRVRIYSEPNYVTIEGRPQLANGPVAKHGRNQFGTKIVSHQAGLSSYWSDNQNVRGCVMNGSQLFGNATAAVSRGDTLLTYIVLALGIIVRSP
jgi:hypothetical protein